MEEQKPKTFGLIKNIYLYLVCFVTLIMMIISSFNFLSIGLKTYVFKNADNYSYGYCYPAPAPSSTSTTSTPTKGEFGCPSEAEQKRQAEQQRVAQREHDLSIFIPMFVVSALVFAFHWNIVRKREDR